MQLELHISEESLRLYHSSMKHEYNEIFNNSEKN